MILDIYGQKTEIEVCEKVFSLCDEIKKLAEEQLEKITQKDEDDAEVYLTVSNFMEESLAKLLGESFIIKVFKNTEKSLPKLSGALCYVISRLDAEVKKATKGEVGYGK